MKNQLPKKLSPADDCSCHQQGSEIDLIQIFIELWKGKKIIASSAIIFLLVGLSYLVIKPDLYILSVNYKVEVYAPEVLKLCKTENVYQQRVYKDCLNTEVLNQYIEFLPFWNVDIKNSTLSINVDRVDQDTEGYQRELDDINNKNTLIFLDETKRKIDVMNRLKPVFQGTEIVAESILKAKQSLSLLDSGGIKLLTFGKPKIQKKPSKNLSIIAFSLLLGVFLGSSVVMIRIASVVLRLRMESDLIVDKKMKP